MFTLVLRLLESALSLSALPPPQLRWQAGAFSHQVRRQRQEPFVEAGEAPTPPPDTWEADSYKKAEGATSGIAT